MKNDGINMLDRRFRFDVAGEVMRNAGVSTQQPYNKRMPEDTRLMILGNENLLNIKTYRF